MDELFNKLGLSQKEANCYRQLLSTGSMTVSDIAQALKENRTNTYMILDKLEKYGLISKDESKAVRRYSAIEPSSLKSIILNKQQEIKHTSTLLNRYLPELQSTYNLSKFKPGVVYLEGKKGLEIILDDMSKSNEELLLLPGIRPEKEVWDILIDGISKRARKGIKTRAIFPEANRKTLDNQLHIKQKYEVKYWNEPEYPSEIVVYGSKCVFTAYQPKIVITVITNDIIAVTLKGIFENLWQNSKY
jgi:sugar-specific transcriptional regulator TrmB